MISFGRVKAGEVGGYIEKEENLSQEGDAWIYDQAKVYGNAWIHGNARICENAEICGKAEICGDSWVCGRAQVRDKAQVCGNTRLFGNAYIYGNARIYGDAKVWGDAWICGDAQVYGDARICGNAWICGDARICKNSDYVSITGFGDNHGTATFFREKDGAIRVRQGHFYGNLEEYREQAGKKAEYRLPADRMECFRMEWQQELPVFFGAAVDKLGAYEEYGSPEDFRRLQSETKK